MFTFSFVRKNRYVRNEFIQHVCKWVSRYFSQHDNKSLNLRSMFTARIKNVYVFAKFDTKLSHDCIFLKLTPKPVIRLLSIFLLARRSGSVNKLTRTKRKYEWSDFRATSHEFVHMLRAIKRISNDPQKHQRLQWTSKTKLAALNAWSQRKINCTVAKIVAQNCAYESSVLKVRNDAAIGIVNISFPGELTKNRNKCFFLLMS